MVPKKYLALLLLGYCLYAGLFIYQTSFVIDGQRYFSLFDDAMVSMRYAKNLAHGDGAVWNPGGQRVEGFTNPLWMLYMAAIHLLPIAPTKISLVIQLTSALLLLLNLLVIKKIAELVSNGSVFTTLVALVFTATYLPLNNWALQGMEVGLLACLISTSVWLALQSLQSTAVSPGLYLLLGLGTLVRPDMAVPFLAILLFLLITQPQHRLRQAIIGGSTLALFLIVQTAFRWSYYGDILPNTYYLKMTGYPFSLRIARGMWVFLDFIFRMRLAVLVIPFFFLLARRDRRIALLLTVIAAQCAYSIYVGGDAWEWSGGSNRYISTVMPLFFVIFACALNYLRSLWENFQRERTAHVLSTTSRRQNTAVIAALIILSLICVNTIRGPRTLAKWLLISRPLHIDDNQFKIEMGEVVKRITTNNATVAIAWAGGPGYFMDRYAIDILGKNDWTLARHRMHLPPAEASLFNKLTFFYPGHLKYDYGYSINQLQPDVIAQLWKQPEQAEPYLSSYQMVVLSDHKLFLRKSSPQILWDEVARLEHPKENLASGIETETKH